MCLENCLRWVVKAHMNAQESSMKEQKVEQAIRQIARKRSFMRRAVGGLGAAPPRRVS